jgi:hypothetical protein
MGETVQPHPLRRVFLMPQEEWRAVAGDDLRAFHQYGLCRLLLRDVYPNKAYWR